MNFSVTPPFYCGAGVRARVRTTRRTRNCILYGHQFGVRRVQRHFTASTDEMIDGLARKMKDEKAHGAIIINKQQPIHKLSLVFFTRCWSRFTYAFLLFDAEARARARQPQHFFFFLLFVYWFNLLARIVSELLVRLRGRLSNGQRGAKKMPREYNKKCERIVSFLSLFFYSGCITRRFILFIIFDSYSLKSNRITYCKVVARRAHIKSKCFPLFFLTVCVWYRMVRCVIKWILNVCTHLYSEWSIIDNVYG